MVFGHEGGPEYRNGATTSCIIIIPLIVFSFVVLIIDIIKVTIGSLPPSS